MVKGYYSYDPLSHVTSWSESILVMEETGLPEENPLVRLTMTETQLMYIDCRGEGLMTITPAWSVISVN